MFSSLRYDERFSNQNVVLVTLDSCRFDSFDTANMPVLKSACTFIEAGSNGTFSYPSHLAIFSGFLPSCNEPRPYYNRIIKYLFFIRGGAKEIASFVEFPQRTESIVHGFAAKGYKTLGFGAVQWFWHPNLRSGFSTFFQTGTDFEVQTRTFLSEASSSDSQPVFGFFNVGETHDPYRYGGKINQAQRIANKMRAEGPFEFNQELWQQQVACCEFVDRFFSRLFDVTAHGVGIFWLRGGAGCESRYG
jgi:hypothetical protein